MSVEHLLESGEVAYRTCSCRHCPEIAVGTAGAICGDCEEAGCTTDGCEREDEILAELFPPASDQACTLDCECDYDCDCCREAAP